LAREFEAKRIFIVTDAGVMEAGLVDKVKGSLEKEKMSFEIFHDAWRARL